MSAYKQFNTQDLIVSPFEVNKSFSFLDSEFPSNSINWYDIPDGTFDTSFLTNKTLVGNPGEEEYTVLLANSIKQLYYTNYISGSAGFTQDAITSSILLGANRDGDTFIGGVQQSNFYNYEQTTLFPAKILPPIAFAIISIPSKLFGDYIQPNSFEFSTVGGSYEGTYRDDGNGRMVNSIGDFNGNIIYQHGIIIVRKADPLFSIMSSGNVTASFSSSYKLFETQYQCTIGENEFNYTLNPSAVTGSQIPTVFSGSSIEWENTASIGSPLGFVTSSFFEPYITTVGLYDENHQLLAVGKLAKPLQSSPTTDTTILVNIDR
jgi:hypothetical protein